MQPDVEISTIDSIHMAAILELPWDFGGWVQVELA